MLVSFLENFYIKLISVLILSLLALFAIPYNDGSEIIFMIFSIISIFLFYDAMNRFYSFSYLFLVGFITLGFFAKSTLHAILSYGYREPVGKFSYSPSEWNEVYLVVIIGLCGVFFAKEIFLFFFKKNELFKNYESAPPWYSKLRIKIWMIWSLFILAGLIFYYVMYSKYGASSANALPRPLWGILVWYLSFFSIISIFTLIYWDQSLGCGWYRGGLAVLLVTLLIGAVIQSRAISIFFTIPFLCVVFQIKSMYINLNNKKVFLILFIWLVFIFINVSFVNLTRYSENTEYAYLFNFIYSESINSKALVFGPNDYFDNNFNGSFADYFSQLHTFVLQLSKIVIDRWIGMEGVMSLVAFPDKSMDLFIRGLTSSRELGKLDLYTSEIVGIELSQEVLKFQQYTAVPGSIAFFYFTGSLLWVFIGMLALTFLMLSTERLVDFLTTNPFVSIYWGMSTAFLIASITPALIHPFRYFSFSLFILFLIWLAPRVLHYFKHRAY